MAEGDLIASFCGAALGAVSVLVVQAYLQTQERRLRVRDLRLEAYAEWIVGMEEQLRAYAHQSVSGTSGASLQLCQRRLELLDPKSPALMKAVWASFPAGGTAEFEELRAEYSTPDPDWPPFRASLDALMEHARRSVA